MPKEYLTTIIVNQKSEFTDPRAEKLQKQMQEFGIPVKSVKIGKRFEIKQNNQNISQAAEAAGQMTEKLLINPVIEESTEIFIKINHKSKITSSK